MIRKHKVLVVDDEPEAREELRAACAGLGHEVLVAATVEEATAALKERPCYMVVDNVLPLREGMTPWSRAGTNFVREVRKKFSAKQLPAIVVTGRGTGEDVIAAFKAGMNDFAFKPFDKAKDDPLDKKIREVLEFGCESRRSCPHHGEEDGPISCEPRKFTARYRLHFVGDVKKGRCLVEIDDKPIWVQHNTFDVLWKLWIASQSSRDDGWVHGSKLVMPTNFSLSVGRVVKDLAKVAEILDLVECDRGKGRLRLCIPGQNVSYEEGFMKLEHKPLLKLLEGP